MKMMNSMMNESMRQSIPIMNSRKEESKTMVSDHLQAMQSQLKHPNEIMNMNEGGRERKFQCFETAETTASAVVENLQHCQ